MDPLSTASTVAGMVILGGKLTVAAHAFVEKIKDCPRRVKNIESDLRSITQILQKLEKSLLQPTIAGVFSLEDKRQEFESVIEGLREIFEELEELIKKYDGLNGIGGLWKKTKWASVGAEEATQLGRLLAAQKGTLSITLALTHGEQLSSIGQGMVDTGNDLRIIMSRIEWLRLQGTGATDPRIEGWLESVATYAGSTMAPEDAATISKGWSPSSSSTNFSVATMKPVLTETRSDDSKTPGTVASSGNARPGTVNTVVSGGSANSGRPGVGVSKTESATGHRRTVSDNARLRSFVGFLDSKPMSIGGSSDENFPPSPSSLPQRRHDSIATTIGSGLSLSPTSEKAELARQPSMESLALNSWSSTTTKEIELMMGKWNDWDVKQTQTFETEKEVAMPISGEMEVISGPEIPRPVNETLMLGTKVDEMRAVAIGLRDQGRMRESEKTLRDLVDLKTQKYGEDFIGTLHSTKELAVVLHIQDEKWKHTEAINILRTVVQRQTKLCGETNENTLDSALELGQWLAPTDWKEAEKIMKHTVQLWSRSCGHRHPATMDAMDKVASAIHQQGNYKDAIRMGRQVVGLRSDSYGEEHPRTLRSKSQLAISLWDGKNRKQGYDLQEKVIKSQEKVLGLEHPETLANLDRLAKWYQKEDKYEKAEKTQRLLLQRFTMKHRADDGECLPILRNLVWFCIQLGKEDEARVIVDEMRVLWPEFEPPHWMTAL